jgi:hypothetical protein
LEQHIDEFMQQVRMWKYWEKGIRAVAFCFYAC